MKTISLAPLALVAAVAIAGLAQAQSAVQPSAAPAGSSSQGAGKLSHDCKEEVKKACGRAHGDEMQNCIKSSLDLNKFSDSCKTQLQAAAAKKSSG